MYSSTIVLLLVTISTLSALTAASAMSIMPRSFAMATSYPADVLRDARGYGVFRAGGKSNAIHLSHDMTSVKVL